MFSNKMATRRILPLCLILLAALACTSRAKIIYVDDDANAPGDGSSWQNAFRFLQDGLAVAKSGDEVRVAQGMYRPDRSAAKPEGSRDRDATFHLIDQVTLKGGFAGVGTPDPNVRDISTYRSILSGDLAGNDVELTDPLAARDEPTRSDNCYHVVSYNERREQQTDLDTEMDGFVITGGHALLFKEGSIVSMTTPDRNRGGGVFICGDRVASVKAAVRDCEFVDNYCEASGGALYCYIASDLSVTRCTFVGNGSHIRGGGMDVSSRETVLSSCRFRGNSAGQNGGGVRTTMHAVLTDCVFTENHARCGGGLLIDGGSASISDCGFVHNSATWGGAAAVYADTEFSDCNFVGNVAEVYGGAISHSDFDTLKLNQCILSGNMAQESGGAIRKGYGQLSLENCTVSGNKAPQGRLLFEATPLKLVNFPRGWVHVTNCIISNGGDEIWNNGGLITIQYTDIPSGPIAVHDPNTMIIWGQGNIDGYPCFADPGHWDPNGTPDNPRDDSWIDGDYHPKSQAGRWDPNSQSWVTDDVTSPCVDAGDPNSPVGDEPLPNGGRINMGAYGGTPEASKSPFGEGALD